MMTIEIHVMDGQMTQAEMDMFLNNGARYSHHNLKKPKLKISSLQ